LLLWSDTGQKSPTMNNASISRLRLADPSKLDTTNESARFGSGWHHVDVAR
jgi:hypothetical protein